MLHDLQNGDVFGDEYLGQICVTGSSPPGQRCLKPATAGGFKGIFNASGSPLDDTVCVEMKCSAEGAVLVGDEICDPGESSTIQQPTPSCMKLALVDIPFATKGK